jgi:hypothetical protein
LSAMPGVITGSEIAGEAGVVVMGPSTFVVIACL